MLMSALQIGLACLLGHRQVNPLLQYIRIAPMRSHVVAHRFQKFESGVGVVSNRRRHAGVCRICVVESSFPG